MEFQVYNSATRRLEKWTYVYSFTRCRSYQYPGMKEGYMRMSRVPYRRGPRVSVSYWTKDGFFYHFM